MIMSLIMNSCQCTLIADQAKLLVMFIDCVLMTGRGQMTMLYTLIRGQMSYTFFQLGGTCPPMSISWGQMSSYAIFHRGAHVRGGGGGGECPTLGYFTLLITRVIVLVHTSRTMYNLPMY